MARHMDVVDRWLKAKQAHPHCPVACAILPFRNTSLSHTERTEPQNLVTLPELTSLLYSSQSAGLLNLVSPFEMVREGHRESIEKQ